MVPFTSETLVTAQEICIRMDPLPVPHGNGVDSAVSTSGDFLVVCLLGSKEKCFLQFCHISEGCHIPTASPLNHAPENYPCSTQGSPNYFSLKVILMSVTSAFADVKRWLLFFPRKQSHYSIIIIFPGVFHFPISGYMFCSLWARSTEISLPSEFTNH